MKRKGTRTSCHVPTDFDEVKSVVFQNIKEAVSDHNVHPSMVVNFDQTGTQMVPVRD